MWGRGVEKRIEIRLLGEMEIVREGRALALPASKKSRALLGYLVATARPQLRERLCELLWDGPDDPRAALRWSLTKLRPLVDDGRRTRRCADRERVTFEPHGADIDLHAVRTAVGAGGVAAAPTAALEAAAARFRGELLEGLDLPDCYRFHEWCVSEREAARSLRIAILSTLAERLAAAPEAALRYARARAAIGPRAQAARVAV